jgi:hypothetical protein
MALLSFLALRTKLPVVFMLQMDIVGEQVVEIYPRLGKRRAVVELYGLSTWKYTIEHMGTSLRLSTFSSLWLSKTPQQLCIFFWHLTLDNYGKLTTRATTHNTSRAPYKDITDLSMR